MTVIRAAKPDDVPVGVDGQPSHSLAGDQFS